MSWWNNFGNTVGGWFGGKQKPPSDPEAPIKSLIKSAPMPTGQIGENARMKRELLGSLNKGGRIKKTGIYKLHKGEEVLSKKKAEMARKM